MSLRTTVLQNLQGQNYLRLVCGPWDMSRSYEKQVMFHVLRCPQQSWSWPSENTDSHCAFLQLCAFSGFFTNSNQTPVVFVMLCTGLEKGSSWFECSFLSQEPAFCQPDRVQRLLHYVALVVTVQVAQSVFSHSQITMPLRAAARALKAKGLLNHQCVLKVLKPKSTFCSKTTKKRGEMKPCQPCPVMNWAWNAAGSHPSPLETKRQEIMHIQLNPIDFPEFSWLQWWYCVDCMRFTYNTIPYHTMLYHYIHNTTQYNAIHYITYLHTYIYIHI